MTKRIDRSLTRWLRRPRPPCPRCESTEVIPVAYGLPGPELFDAAERGEVVIAGCIVNDSDPQWHCTKCDQDFGAPPALEPWKAPVVELLRKAGYTQFGGQEHAIRIEGPGPFGERIAIARNAGSFNLFVRRGGEAGVRQIAERVSGGQIEGAALAFRAIDLESLDQILGAVVARLRELD